MFYLARGEVRGIFEHTMKNPLVFHAAEYNQMRLINKPELRDQVLERIIKISGNVRSYVCNWPWVNQSNSFNSNSTSPIYAHGLFLFRYIKIWNIFKIQIIYKKRVPENIRNDKKQQRTKPFFSNILSGSLIILFF